MVQGRQQWAGSLKAEGRCHCRCHCRYRRLHRRRHLLLLHLLLLRSILPLLWQWSLDMQTMVSKRTPLLLPLPLGPLLQPGQLHG